MIGLGSDKKKGRAEKEEAVAKYDMHNQRKERKEELKKRWRWQNAQKRSSH